MPTSIVDRVETPEHLIEDRDAARRLVRALREIVNVKESRQEFADFLRRMLGLPTEVILNNSKVFSEYMFVKLVLENTILEADEPELQVCDPRQGRHLKELSYRIFAEEYLNEISRVKNGNGQQEITEETIVQYLISYETVLKTQGLSYFGALFAKRVFRCLGVNRKNFKSSYGTMLAMVLATHGIGMYWSSVFSSYEVVFDFELADRDRSMILE